MDKKKHTSTLKNKKTKNNSLGGHKDSAKKKKVAKEKSIYQPRILVMGIGGGGSSIVNEMAKNFYRKDFGGSGKIKFMIANVDSLALRQAPKKVLTFHFGNKVTAGLGCGMDPAKGKVAAMEAKKDVEKILKKYDLCIFIASLGGGTGSGATPIFTEVAKNLGILSWGIFTKPFSFEGRERSLIARESLSALSKNLNAFTIIPNQKIFKIIEPTTSIRKSLSVINNILANALGGFVETFYSPGLINLDFSDLRAILEDSNNLAYLSCQESSGKNRAESVVKEVLENPLMEHNINGAKKILFNIIGDRSIKMNEVEQISKRVYLLNPLAKIIFGVTEDKRLKNKIKLVLLAVGCEKPIKPKKQKRIPQKREKEKTKENTKKEVSKNGNESLKNGRKNREKEKKKKTKKEKFSLEIKKGEGKENTKDNQTKEEAKKEQINENKNLTQVTRRRNALDLHQQIKEAEEKILEEEKKWDIPAFLRSNDNKDK